MKLEVSNKQGGGFIKPLIRKGYYPAKVLSIEPRKDAEGNLFENKWGNQLIVRFQVWKPDSDGNPVEVMTCKGKIEGTETEVEQDVELALFSNYTYKNKEGELESAFTPNSRITNQFKALGWEFDSSGIDTDEFVGVWTELNVDDYEKDGTKMSVIKDMNRFEGKIPSDSASKPVKKKEKVKEEPKDSMSDELDLDADIIDASNVDLPDEIQAQIDNMQEQVATGLISEETFQKIKEDIISKHNNK